MHSRMWACRYVDVGAYHPWVRSNTWFLDVCLGWRGVCVEGNPALLPAFARSNRSCVVVGKFLSRSRRLVGFERGVTEMLGRLVAPGGATVEGLHTTATFGDMLEEAGWRAGVRGASGASRAVCVKCWHGRMHVCVKCWHGRMHVCVCTAAVWWWWWWCW